MTLPIPPALPVLPAPRARALILLMNPDAPLDGFVAIVEGDPSLTLSVLRAANSVASSPIAAIRSAREAVIRLGLAQVRQIVTTAVLRSEFDDVDRAGVDTDEMWRHLLGTAVLAEAAAPAGPAAETAFVAGLLHDIGRLAMAAQAPSRYRRVVDVVQDGMDASAAEQDIFGVDHAAFGATILARWQLPAEVIAAVAGHHGDPADEAGAALHLGRSIIAGLGIGDGVRRPDRRDPAMEDHPLVARLGGREGLMSEIRWFREATVGRTPGLGRRTG
ncbi:MAG: HDOD domain-containing protein [Chloroflexi bacterium]|nr:HDOD domain-containing protein [Chloroflexota bacterium]MDA1239989.1 HDOD domain-containing protein [Chloroflexota bacterium]